MPRDTIVPPNKEAEPHKEARLFWSVTYIPLRTSGMDSKPHSYSSLAAGDNDRHNRCGVTCSTQDALHRYYTTLL